MDPIHPPAVFDGDSPARQVLERLPDRWSTMVICALGSGPKRYGELRRRLQGISSKIQAQILRGLERDGLVVRTVHPTQPPRGVRPHGPRPDPGRAADGPARLVGGALR